MRTRLYDPHYNPFVYYESVRDTSFGRSRVVDFDELRDDLRRGRLPRFSWIAPGVLHDGHDGSLREADRYASVLVPRVLRALGPRGVLYLTWDEGARSDPWPPRRALRSRRGARRPSQPRSTGPR